MLYFCFNVFGKFNIYQFQTKLQKDEKNKALIIFCRRDGTMVRLLTSVVIVLVISHTPRTFINLYESYNIGKIGLKYLFSYNFHHKI